MSGNSTSLYTAVSSSNGTTTSNNFTTLYPNAQGVIVPTTPYGNANVVSLLAAGSDGGNTISNIVAAGNVYSGNVSATGNIYAQNVFANIVGNLVVPGSSGQVLFNTAGEANASAGLTFSTSSNVLSATGGVSTPVVFGQGIATQGFDYVQMQYSNSVALPVSQYDIGTGSWFYLDPGGGVFQSNTTGTLQTIVQGNDGSVSATGNVTGNYIFGNGSQLTGLPATYSNANVATFLADFGSNVVSTTGNITGGYFLGNGSQLTGLPATYTDANVVTLMANFGSNIISTTGNVTSGYFLGNGSQLTGLPEIYGNANVATYLASGTNTQDIITQGTVQGNLLTTAGSSGNIIGVNFMSANFYLGNGSLLTGVAATSVGILPTLSVTGNTTTGNLLTGGLVSAAGNITGSYIFGNGSQLTGLPATYSNANVVSLMANFGSNIISTTGNITGANLTITTDAVIQGNLTVNGNTTFINSNTVTINDKFINVANNAATAGAANGGGLGVGPVGTEYATLTYNSTANAWNTNLPISVTGNVTGDYFIGNGSQLTGVVATSVGTLASLSVTGNINTGNLRTAGQISATGNLTVGNIQSANVSASNFDTPGTVSAGSLTGGVIIGSGNVTGGNFRTTGLITATGNVTGNFFIGNGSALTGVVATSVGTLASLSVTGNTQTGNLLTGGLISATGNIRGGNISAAGTISGGNISGANIDTPGTVSSGVISASGNITGGNFRTAGLITATGNVTGNFFIGNGSQLTGIASTYGNANVVANLAALGSNPVSTTGNVTAGYFIGNGSLLTSITGANVTGTVANATYATTAGSATTATSATTAGTVTGNAQANITSVGVLTSLSVSGNTQSGNLLTAGLVSATGNITGNYILGNGSQLTGVVATSVGTLASLSVTGNIDTGNLRTAGQVSATGNITGANLTIANISATGRIDVIGNGQIGNIYTAGVISATGNVRGGNLQALAGNVTATGQLSATGNVIGGNITTVGLVSATGNVTGNFFIGNGSQLTGIAASYGNANVSNFLANFGSNSISTIGNITAGYFVGNGSLLTSITGGNVTGTVANATYATSAGTATSATTAGTVTSNAQANITSVGTLTSLSVSGNTQSGNLLTAGVVSATGNITGNYFIGNGSQLTGISAGGSPGGSNTQIQYNNASAFGGNANFTFNNSTGNINLGNVIFTTGNATNFINTVAPFSGVPANVLTLANSQIVIGNGWNGNTNLNNQFAASARGGKFQVWDTLAISDSGGPRYAGISSAPVLSLTGNISNTNTNLRGLVGALAVGGSSSNYQIQTTAMGTVAAATLFLSVGQPNTAVAYGNTTVLSGSGIAAQITTQAGSIMGNAALVTQTYTGGGNITNVAGTLISFNAFPFNTPTNVYGVYMNSSTTNGIFGNAVNQDPMRNATNYYFLRNDDNVAQTKLGSLRLFNEFQYDGANTSGTLAVDKNNGQVQTVYITGDITSVTFSNFVTSASNGFTTKYQTDTVTLILRQGSTPYAVTMPTGTAYKYAAGASTVGTTANAVTMISITGTYDSVSAANQYLITISPEFT